MGLAGCNGTLTKHSQSTVTEAHEKPDAFRMVSHSMLISDSSAFTSCSERYLGGKVIALQDKERQVSNQYGIIVPDRTAIIAPSDMKNDEIIAEPCLSDHSPNENADDDVHSPLLSHSRRIKHTNQPRRAKKSLDTLNGYVPGVKAYSQGLCDVLCWEVLGSVVENLKERKELMEDSMGTLLDLHVYIDVGRCTYTFKGPKFSSLHVGNFYSSTNGQLGGPKFISENMSNKAEITFGGERHCQQKLEVRLSRTATLIPYKLYKELSSVLRQKGFEMKGGYYEHEQSCQDTGIKALNENVNLLISFPSEGGPSISINGYIEQSDGTCRIPYLPGSDGKWVLGMSVLRSNSAVINAWGPIKRYKFVPVN
uniref:AlNc14C22G2276 protein n=1 Tax=Albugo laibachii Nc14 TaxID=890382 RepID=F0W5W1_9STRA|nr:AlNc14C22G2276 [Albugo laibachii Nc14]|eukprot:CCA16502.1 AlNc14C22G2276 [Albugo laibachii Nc14]